MRNTLGNRIGDHSARSTTLGSSACIFLGNRIMVGFLFLSPVISFFPFFIVLFSVLSHFIFTYMARDHAES